MQFQTHYIESGCGSVRVVWFPAVGDSALNFGKVLLKLSKDLNGIASILAVDPPGYGSSPLPAGIQNLSFRHLELWVKAFISNLQGPFVLVGNSSGGAIATAAALSRKSKVQGLVYVCWPDWRFGTPPKSALCPSNKESLQKLLSLSWHRPPKLSSSVLTNLLDKLNSQAYYEHINSFDSSEFSKQLDSVQVQAPLAFIGGTSDQVVHPSIIRASVNLHTNSYLNWIPEAGHYPHIEQPNKLSSVLKCIVECFYETS